MRLIQFLSEQQETEINLPTQLGERIIRLLHYLREHRCLVVLDNLESILPAKQRAITETATKAMGFPVRAQ
ncbi:MAG: hypothetical protein KME14_15540 [Tildeniella torsiva UHER 1998/13D]|nr:hypothetical protein [Tildeniella torsiva UHER 1998/13D]